MFVYYYLNKLNISSSKFWVQDLQRLVVEQPIQSGYFFMKFISDVSKDIILISQQEPFLMVTRLHIPSWSLFLWHSSSPQIPHNLFFSCILSESLLWLSFFFEKKKTKSESYIDWIFQWLSVYRDLYSSSSSWLAAGNSHKEEPSSVLETCCHPGETTMERYIFDDVVTLCSKNGKKSRKQRISECITWYIVHMETLLNCYPT